MLHEILNNSLDITKLDEGKIEFDKNYYNIESIVKLVMNITKTNAEKRGVALQYDQEFKLPFLFEFDKSRIVQVIMNFVGNAIKFTPSKGKVTISANWQWKCGYNNGNCAGCTRNLIEKKLHAGDLNVFLN